MSRTDLLCLAMAFIRNSVLVLSTLGTRIPVYSGIESTGYSYVGTYDKKD